MVLIFRNRLRSFLIFILSYLFVGILLLVVYRGQENILRTSINETVKTDMKSYSSDIDNRVANVISDVLLLERLFINSEVFSYDGNELTYSSLEQKQRLENDLFDWIDINTEYDQIRFLNNEGYEMIRVNSNDGNPIIIQEEDYQNKSGRYYFENAINLSDETIYLSKIDLNIENGEIEYIDGRPKQMLRVATTVYQDESKIGLIIVNYLVENLFHDDDTNISSYTVFEALNEDGYYLHSDNESIEYGFMFADKQDEVFNKYHEFDILNVDKEIINQDLLDGEVYTSLVINKIKMSESLFELLGRTIPIYSDNGEIILVGEVELFNVEQFQTLRLTYLILFSVSGVTLLFITRLLDEIIYSNEEKIDTLEYASNHDKLTGLVNRKRLFEIVENKILDKERFTLLFLDLNGFKLVNDEFGHQVGDRVLIDTSNRIRNLIREIDIVSRLGGDEFIIVISKTTDKSVIERVRSNIEEALQEPFVYEDVIASVGVSIGIAVEDGTLSADDIIKLADKRMYENKYRNKENYKD